MIGTPSKLEWPGVAKLINEEGILPVSGNITVREKGIGGLIKDGKVLVKTGYTWHMGTVEAMAGLERKEKEEEVIMSGRGENVMDVRISQRFLGKDWAVFEERYEECQKTYKLLAEKGRKKDRAQQSLLDALKRAGGNSKGKARRAW